MTILPKAAETRRVPQGIKKVLLLAGLDVY